MWKNAHYKFPEPDVTSSNCFCCPADSLKPTDSSVALRNDKEKQQFFIFKKLKPANEKWQTRSGWEIGLWQMCCSFLVLKAVLIDDIIFWTYQTVQLVLILAITDLLIISTLLMIIYQKPHSVNILFKCPSIFIESSIIIILFYFFACSEHLWNAFEENSKCQRYILYTHIPHKVPQQIFRTNALLDLNKGDIFIFSIDFVGLRRFFTYNMNVSTSVCQLLFFIM